MIHRALVALLRDHEGVAGMVGQRITPRRLDRDPQLPAITYQRVSTPRDLAHDGDQGFAGFRVQINCWGHQGTTEAEDLAGQVRLALNGFRGAAAGVDVGVVWITGDRDEDDPERSMERTTVDAVGNFREETA